jgi:hypothetical protein
MVKCPIYAVSAIEPMAGMSKKMPEAKIKKLNSTSTMECGEGFDDLYEKALNYLYEADRIRNEHD